MGSRPYSYSSQDMTNELLDSIKVVDVTLSLDTNIYASGDVLAAVQEVTGVFDYDGQGRILQSIQVIDEDDQAGAFDIVIGNATFALGTENAAVSITDAAARNIVHIQSIAATDYVDLVNSQQAFAGNLSVPIRAAAADTSLYIAAISRDTKTYSASGIRLRLGFV